MKRIVEENGELAARIEEMVAERKREIEYWVSTLPRVQVRNINCHSERLLPSSDLESRAEIMPSLILLGQ